MVEPKQGYWCTECGDTFSNENVEVCQCGTCAEYVCPDCDGKYCEDCRAIIEREDIGESEAYAE
jgi:hypothetical protein